MKSDRPHHRAKKEELLKAVEESLRHAQPILLDLARLGIHHIIFISDLVFRKEEDYKKALPTLLSWLPRISDLGVKSQVIQALTFPLAKGVAASPLIQEFRQTANENIRWDIGAALSVVADDAVFDDIVQLVKDKRYGTPRQMLALALANMKDPRAIDILMELLDDEDVVGHAVMALGKLQAEKARPQIESISRSHPKRWVRVEAQKALKKIDARK